MGTDCLEGVVCLVDEDCRMASFVFAPVGLFHAHLWFRTNLRVIHVLIIIFHPCTVALQISMDDGEELCRFRVKNELVGEGVSRNSVAAIINRSSAWPIS